MPLRNDVLQVLLVLHPGEQLPSEEVARRMQLRSRHTVGTAVARAPSSVIQSERVTASRYLVRRLAPGCCILDVAKIDFDRSPVVMKPGDFSSPADRVLLAAEHATVVGGILVFTRTRPINAQLMFWRSEGGGAWHRVFWPAGKRLKRAGILVLVAEDELAEYYGVKDQAR